MKKTSLLKKISMFVVVLAVILIEMPFMVQAASAPATITTGNSKALEGYVDGLYFALKTTSQISRTPNFISRFPPYFIYYE